ncbi:SURF1 family cytochrome oxidase biogenesis protein [Tomitella biformata]|uniref:SURF1 family cytochrome oxidase biogenesis protein n=1 Tax=Tomitella biformata TaxID=630403 RepID=UPI0004667A47|nr:SURF1 family protein [Tomitella biformata]
MRRLSFLLRPGWLILIALCGVFIYLCFTVLAPWQLNKNDENSYRNGLIAESMQAEPKPVGELFGEQTTLGPEDEWRQVAATGVYLADKQVLARLRSVDADPAFEVLAPFQLDDGRIILVDRGYVWPDEHMKPPAIPAPPTGTVTLDGRVRTSESPWGTRGPIVEGGWTQVYSIHTAGLSELLDVPLLGNYLQLNDGAPGGLGVIALPQLDAGPYLSYGLQWIAFGVMVPLAAGYFAWAEIKERRRRAEEEEELEGTADGEGSDDADGPGDSGERADDLDHVLLGRRKRKTERYVPLAPQKAKLPPEQQATLAERYSKKR